MPEYIEREEALRMMKTSKKDKPSWGDWDIAHDCCIDCVNAAPTADVVAVVRCKDCKHRYELLCCYGEYDYGYCNYGERKE